MVEYTNTNNGDGDGDSDDDDDADAIDLLPICYILPGDTRGQWASCDWVEKKTQLCHTMLQKFGILMGTVRSTTKYNNNYLKKNVNSSTATGDTKIPITTNTHVELNVFVTDDDENNNTPTKK